MTLMTTRLTWLRVAFDDKDPRHVSEISCYIYMNPPPYIFHYFLPRHFLCQSFRYVPDSILTSVQFCYIKIHFVVFCGLELTFLFDN